MLALELAVTSANFVLLNYLQLQGGGSGWNLFGGMRTTGTWDR